MAKAIEIVDVQVKDDPNFWPEAMHSTRWGMYLTGREREALLQAHHWLGEPTTAVDVGCGRGRWSRMLLDLGWSMTCVEVDPRLLKITKGKVPAARCLLVSEESSEIPCDSESMGMVLCMEVAPVAKAHWFPREAYRVLKKEGLLVGVFFNFLSYRGMAAHFTCSRRNSYDYFERAYVPWRRQASRMGFTFLREEGLCWFPFRRASNSTLIPGCTRLERYLGLRRLPGLSPWVVFVARKNGA